MRNLLITFLLVFLVYHSNAQKQSLTQEVYNDWKTLQSPSITKSGSYITYKSQPQKNDPAIVIYNCERESKQVFNNGDKVSIDFEENFAFIRIKPQQDTIRNLKIKEVKKENFPHDTLKILEIREGIITALPHLKSYYCPDKGGEWISIHFEKIPETIDTTAKDTTKKEKKKPKKKKDKSIPECTSFMALNVAGNDTIRINAVSDFAMDRYGNHILVAGNTGDSLVFSYLIHINTTLRQHDTLFKEEGIIKSVQIGGSGKYGAFFFSADTAKEKVWTTQIVALAGNNDVIQIDTSTNGVRSNWSTNINHNAYFDEKETRLYFSMAPIPEPAQEDTLLDEEKCSVDIWNWKDPLLQTQQIHNKKEESQRGYLAMYDFNKQSFIQLADSTLPEVRGRKQSQGTFLLGSSPLPYQQLVSWDSWYNDIYIIDTKTNTKELILEKQGSYANLSPGENYLLYWNSNDSCWYSYDILEKKHHNLTESLDVNFYNEIHDVPALPSPYRVAGWLENDSRVIISDYYDLWSFDPTGKSEPTCITQQYGRKNKIKFYPVNLIKDEQFLQLEKQSFLLRGFNDITKGSGYYSYEENKEPKLLIEADARFGIAQKAQESEKLIFTKGSFKSYPDLYSANMNFKKMHRISEINPQQNDYLWGDVQLVSWTSSKGEKLEGLLYTPENLNPAKKYPLLVYFYERNSDNLHSHRIPSPSRSIINPTYCTSNGYVVFVPDITYGTGHPGKDCYDAVVSGTLAMCDQFEFIDRSRMGLQGQSWGGYQIAHLVTQTDLYTCAMAGAPVSNMTSAYGGIRWGSGLSRAFQYEKSQSRIGQPLWDAPELYIENSPVFFADQVNTPLLIMHNDEDGAVPWYQGIEYFSALRRLQKPVWMLVYNGAPHNLRRWPDRMDLDKRMMQFFDHYLKDEPAPVWMTDGIPAVKKGIEKGFELK
jgi:acetyl esterase/lipase